MATPTRIQQKSRPTKRPMETFQYDLNGGVLTSTGVPGRKPRLDPKGFPAYKGAPVPVLGTVTVVDTTP